MRVLLVDTVRLMCSVMAAVLENEPDVTIAGTATTLEEALAMASQCDVLLVNSRLPEGGALRLTQAVVGAGLPAKVLVLGLSHSEAEILPYVEAGAVGYVLNDDSVETLIRNMRAAHNDEAQVSPEIAAALITRVAELSQGFGDFRLQGLDNTAELTPREREILELIGQGLNNQEIADHLVIEVGTVKNHVHNILDKLNVTNRREAAAYAMRQWGIERPTTRLRSL